MTPLSGLHLTLFFTDGMSLAEWVRLGILERETALYRALRPRLGGITFVTYGDGRDLEIARGLEGIGVVCNRWRLSSAWYWRRLARIPGRWRLGRVVFKSNQVPGADTALALARRFGKPCIARCGYLHGEFIARRHGPDSPEARRALEREGRVFRGADRVVVTTPAMAGVVTGDHRVEAGRVRVIPNFVETDRFVPDGAGGQGNGILFIGRLDGQKDPRSLIEAADGLAVTLRMVGDGPMRGELEAMARDRGLGVAFPGRLPQGDLPGLMRESALFVLPSLFEGHPKALLEAMACGMAVVGRGDAPGVREVIRHGETGWLYDGTVAGLREAMTRLLTDEPLRRRLGENARAWALAEFSLTRVVALELALLEEVAAEFYDGGRG